MSAALYLPNKTNPPPHPVGWRYKVPETGQEFQSVSFNGLLEKLSAHYKSNGYPIPPDLSELVETFVCNQVPDYCSGAAPKGTNLKYTPGLEHTFHVVLQGTKTLWSWVKGGRERVSMEVSEARAKVCATCPENQEPQGCNGCNTGALAQLMEAIVGSRRTTSDAQLKSCRVCHCGLRAKVTLPLDVMWPHFTDEQKERFPAYCWLIREQV